MHPCCYTVFHRRNMSTLQTDNNWSKYTRKLFKFTHPPRDFGSGCTKSSAFLCLHAEKISFLELRVAISGLKTMANFSHMQSLQTPVTGLNVGMLVLNNIYLNNIRYNLTCTWNITDISQRYAWDICLIYFKDLPFAFALPAVQWLSEPI